MMGDMLYRFGGFSHHMVWGGGIIAMIGGFLLLALLIYGIVLLTRHRQPGQSISNSAVQQDNGSALNILNERYARGEVNEEEYTRKKTELRR